MIFTTFQFKILYLKLVSNSHMKILKLDEQSIIILINLHTFFAG